MASKAKAKAVAATIRLVIPAGQAKPSPPVGPALGQAGLKIMDFCKDFNAKTADFQVGAGRTPGACRAKMGAGCTPLVGCPGDLGRRRGQVRAHLACTPPSLVQSLSHPPPVSLQSDVPVPVVITAFADKTFKWSMKTPPASYFIKRAAGLASGSQKPGHQVRPGPDACVGGGKACRTHAAPCCCCCCCPTPGADFTALSLIPPSPTPQNVGAISLKHLHEIAQVKQKDSQHVPLESVVKSLMGSCRSMGVRVVPRPEDA